MPSWNIHIAQTERLLARDGAVARAVRDENAFLLGNVIPDIMVGYMVPGIAEPIPYRVTHCAEPSPIPKPREREFWDEFVAPLAGALREGDWACGRVEPADLRREVDRVNRIHFAHRYQGKDAPAALDAGGARREDTVGFERSLFDLTLGAWAHLMADNVWNTRVNEFLDAHGGKPSEEFRIKKQNDFDGFGKTLEIHTLPRETERLVRTAGAFPQYAIEPVHVHDALVVAHEIVRTNGVAVHAPYMLLTEEFFSSVFDEVLDATETALAERLGRA